MICAACEGQAYRSARGQYGNAKQASSRSAPETPDNFSQLPWEVLLHMIEYLNIADLACFSATSSFNREPITVQLEEAGVWVDAYGRAFNKKQSYPGSAYLAFVRKAMTRVLRSSCEQVEIVKGDSGDGSSHDENRGLFLSRDSAQPWKVRYLVSAFASGKTTTYDINGLYVRSAMGSEHRNTQTVISNLNAIDVLTSIKQDWENEQRAEHLKCVTGTSSPRLKFPTRDNDDENAFALWDDAGVEDDDECDDSSVDADSSSPLARDSPCSSGGFVVAKDLSMNAHYDVSPPFNPLRRAF